MRNNNSKFSPEGDTLTLETDMLVFKFTDFNSISFFV